MTSSKTAALTTHDTTRIDDVRIGAVRPLITPALLSKATAKARSSSLRKASMCGVSRVRARLQALLDTQSRAISASMTGSVQRVLVERPSRRLLNRVFAREA